MKDRPWYQNQVTLGHYQNLQKEKIPKTFLPGFPRGVGVENPGFDHIPSFLKKWEGIFLEFFPFAGFDSEQGNKV